MAKKNSMDMISQLPEPILHHILCYLPQNDAVRTCVLSKPWRHLGSTRPKIEFCREIFNGNKEIYLSVLDKTLQRYHDQKLSIQEFILETSVRFPESFPLLEKYIPIILLNMGVRKFHLTVYSPVRFFEPGDFRLPSALLKAEFLEELYLENCKMCEINSIVDKVLCNNLRELSLYLVYITDVTLEKILSSCPLIEYLDIFSCDGLQTIKVTKAHNLKCFNFHSRKGDCHSIEIDAPSIETIEMDDCPNWIHHPNMYFPCLKSLDLFKVGLSNESIQSFSTNFPCLEKLNITFLSGTEQFQLSSRSIKHLTIAVEGSFKSANIDATNILVFEFSCEFLPLISFTTTSTEWKSKIRVGPAWSLLDNDDLSWFFKLNEICKALSTSQISLHIDRVPQVALDSCGDLYQPTVIENFSIVGDPSVPDFVNCLFRIVRPRNVRQLWYDANLEWQRINKRENL